MTDQLWSQKQIGLTSIQDKDKEDTLDVVVKKETRNLPLYDIL